MPLAEDIVDNSYRFSAYDAASVSINETVYRQSLVVTAREILCPWPISSVTELDTEALAPIFATAPAVVLLGTGQSQQFPDARILALFGEKGIGLEVMDNGALCRTFNILVAENRAVTAAVILGN